jgi:DNA-directed RNA polymerase sigma subunit (sigma70/sigma32)
MFHTRSGRDSKRFFNTGDGAQGAVDWSTPEQRLLNKELARLITAAIKDLTPLQLAIIYELRLKEDPSSREMIALTQNLTPEDVDRIEAEALAAIQSRVQPFLKN